MKKTIILLHLIIASVLFARPQAEWVTGCKGEAVMENITKDEAKVLAKRYARLEAIEQVCGINVQSETLIQNFVMAGDFIHSISHGQIVGEKNEQWATETLPPAKPGDLPVIIVKVTLDIQVQPSLEQPDPSFKIDLKLNRKNFQTGDEVLFNIKASKACYITLLNIAANDSVYILHPNAFEASEQLPAGQTVQIPSENSREMGLNIRVAALPGHRKDTEIVIAVATQQPMPLLSQIDVSSGFGRMGTPKMAVTTLAQWLSEIPVSKRAEASAMYTVHGE